LDNRAVVLVGPTRGKYTCVMTPDQQHAGWVPSAEVDRESVNTRPPLKAWTGVWRDGDNKIELSIRRSALIVEGEAYWPAARPPKESFPEGPNIGGVIGLTQPEGALAVVRESALVAEGEECTLWLQLIGPYLVASDNGRCGGRNVRFDGVYRRK
jgi:hypothetical protein